MKYDMIEFQFSDIIEATDYVANGSFAALKENVQYLNEGYAILVRLVDHNASWKGDHVYVNKAAYQFLSKSSLVENDIVIANVGANVGTIFRVPKLDRPATLGPNAVRVRPKSNQLAVLDNDYLYYYLISQIGQNKLQGLITGSAQPKFNKTALRGLLMSLPSLSVQKSISATMCTIDEKIEINRQIADTLEIMANSIFNDWFIDFGPVRAKMQSKKSYLPENLWALFPQNLNNAHQPIGWEMQRVSKFLSLVYGKSLPARNRREGIVPVYGSGGITGFHDEALLTEPTIILGRKGTVGSLYWESRPSFPIDTVFYIKPKFSLSFCYYLLSSFPLRTMNTDAAVPGLSRENVYRLEFPSTPLELVTHFAKITDKIHEKIDICNRESEILSQLRNTLLPKLIAGEIRVKDAERIIRDKI